MELWVYIIATDYLKQVQLQLLVFYDFILAVQLLWRMLQMLLSWEVRSCQWYLPSAASTF